MGTNGPDHHVRVVGTSRMDFAVLVWAPGLGEVGGGSRTGQEPWVGQERRLRLSGENACSARFFCERRFWP